MGENERGAERTEMEGKAETDKVGEASGGRWMDRLREFIALALKINSHLTLAFLFSALSLSRLLLPLPLTQLAWSLERNLACSPLKSQKRVVFCGCTGFCFFVFSLVRKF